MSVKSQLRKRIRTASILLLIVVAVLAGWGAIRTYYASLEMHDEDNPARNSRPLKDRYAIEIAQRFGLMALFSTVAYRNDLDDLRESHGIESDCNYKDNWGFGMPQVEGNGRWMRLQSIPATSVLDTSVGCLDDRNRGLFYETYVYRSGDGMFEEAVIAYRGTENVSGQLLSDWSANLYGPPRDARGKSPISRRKRCGHISGIVSGIMIMIDPRALMEFAYLAVLNQALSLSASWLWPLPGFQQGGRAFHAITVNFTLSNSWCRNSVSAPWRAG